MYRYAYIVLNSQKTKTTKHCCAELSCAVSRHEISRHAIITHATYRHALPRRTISRCEESIKIKETESILGNHDSASLYI